MRFRTLGRTGIEVSELGLGLGPAGLLGVDINNFQSIVLSALDQGVNLIDTAASYGEAEALLGSVLRGRSNPVTIVTKCGDFGSNDRYPAWSPALIRRTVDRSLKRIRREPLDVVLLHSCDIEVLRRAEAIGELNRQKDAGKIRHIGYAGDNEAAQYASTLDEVEVVEVSLSIVDQANAEAVLPTVCRHKVGLLVKRPLGNAPWLPALKRQGRYQTYAEPYRDRLLELMPRLLKACGNLEGQDWIRTWFAFVLAHDEVSSMIVGTTRPERLQENASLISAMKIDPSTIECIRAVYREVARQHNWAAQE